MQDLGNGLILRCAQKSDIKLLIEHAITVHSESAGPIVTRLLKYRPDFPITDNFVVFDKNTGKIVAYLCLLRSICVLNGIEFPVGHMEIVGTYPEYRNRNLIRRLNEAFEARVHEYNLPLLVIAGIPFFYRLFGYEYAIPLGGTLPIPSEAIPTLKKEEKEPGTIVEVTAKSFPTYLKCRDKGNAYLDFYRKLAPRDFIYLSKGKLGEEGGIKFYLVKEGNRSVGSFHLTVAWGNLEIRELWLEDSRFIPSVLRFAKRIIAKLGKPLYVEKPSKESLIPSLAGISGSIFGNAYAWYVRIPSIKNFLHIIKPVLEARLAKSDFNEWTGTLRLSCYREGYTLVIQKGKLVYIKHLERKEVKDMDIHIPPLVVNQLLMGYRTFRELSQIYPDVRGNPSKTPLVSVLFPKIRACIRPEI